MKKILLGAIVAAVILIGYIGATALTTAKTSGPKALDIPPILIADAATVDYFLKIEGIPGESSDDRHRGEIEIESWSFGMSQTGTLAMGGGAGAGKVNVQDFHFVMKVNKASPKLMLACATGQHIPEALLTVRKAGGEQQEYLKIKFSDVMVSSYQSSGSGSDVVPMDQISLNYSKIEIEYKEQKPDGSLGEPIKVGYDVKKNKAL